MTSYSETYVRGSCNNEGWFLSQSTSADTLHLEMPMPSLGQIKGEVFDSSTGARIVEAAVSLSPSQGQSTVTDITGTFSFVDLVAGTYNLTASASNYESISQQVTVAAGWVSTVRLLLIPRSPSVSNTVSPAIASSGQVVMLTAQVTDPDGAQDIVSVIADLSPIGLDRYTAMMANNDSWSVQFTVPANAPLGQRVLSVTARDSGGAIGYGDALLEIVASFSGTVTANQPVIQTFDNRVPGQTLIFEFGSSGPQAGVTQVNVRGPDGTTYGPYDISASGQATVENAAAGTWTIEVQTTCPQPVSYSFRARGSGTGLVVGTVKNLAGRMLSGITVTSSSGGVAMAVNGHFIMVVPAGIHTLTANAGFISPGSCTATVEAGSSVTTSLEVEQTLPAIWLELDRIIYSTGETPLMRISLYKGQSQNTVDAYVVLQGPDGRFFQFGTWEEVAGPTVPNFEVIDAEAFEISAVNAITDPGTWIYYGAFATPGTWDVVGEICSARFQVIP